LCHPFCDGRRLPRWARRLMEKLANASRAKAFLEPAHAARSSDNPLHGRPPLSTPHRPPAPSTPSHHGSFRGNDMRTLSSAAGAAGAGSGAQGGGVGPAPPPRSSRPPPTPGAPHADRTGTSSLKTNDSASALSNRLAKDIPLVGAGASSHVDADAVALATEVASANRCL
jgi:hypothetical protein